MVKDAERYITRCFDLARMGAGSVSPNPMVGAVLVHDNQIIGEGYHQKYGAAHAEVNALASVSASNRALIPAATLYVSLEPCCIFGKTPPCTNLIIQEKIPRVVISCLDLTPEVKGGGVELLRKHGIEVITGVLEKQGQALAATRNVSVSQQRPYVILKMAITRNGFFAPLDRSQFWITQTLTKRLVHRWRMEADAILVGTNTALMDDPQLDNRLYYGKSPLRIVLDRKLLLPNNLKIFSDGQATLIITEQDKPINSVSHLHYLSMNFSETFWLDLLAILWRDYKLGVILVEGGQKVLSSLIDTGLWDEARVLIGQKPLAVGIPSPILPGSPEKTLKLGLDELKVYQHVQRS